MRLNESHYEIIKENFGKFSLHDISCMIGCSVVAVKYNIAKLGLEDDSKEKYERYMQRGRALSEKNKERNRESARISGNKRYLTDEKFRERKKKYNLDRYYELKALRKNNENKNSKEDTQTHNI